MSQALAGMKDDIVERGAGAGAALATLVPLVEISRPQWDALTRNLVEPNGFFDPGFALNAAAHAHNGAGAHALAAYSGSRLTGLLPVTTAARALRLSRELGIDAVGSPTPSTRFRTVQTQWRFLLQEVYFFHRDLVLRTA